MLVNSAKGANYICTLAKAKLATIFLKPFNYPLVGFRQVKVSSNEKRQKHDLSSVPLYCVTHDMLHVMSNRLCLGHVSVRVGDNSWCSEIAQISSWALQSHHHFHHIHATGAILYEWMSLSVLETQPSLSLVKNTMTLDSNETRSTTTTTTTTTK